MGSAFLATLLGFIGMLFVLWLVNPIFVAIITFSKDINYVGPSVDGDIDFDDLF